MLRKKSFQEEIVGSIPTWISFATQVLQITVTSHQKLFVLLEQGKSYLGFLGG
jgi:hypothetical protein